MTNTELQNKISGWFDNLSFSEEGSQFLNIEVPKEILRDLSEKLKDDNDTAFNYLFGLTGVDYGKELAVLYHLESNRHRHMIVLKVRTDNRENPEFDSVTDIWPAAYLNECEAYDFFGIKFKNNPKLYRIFLNEEWKGYPLRKDYVDNVNMLIR